MALHVIEQYSTFSPDMSRGSVIIESDLGPPFERAFQELDGVAPVYLAQSYAASKGCAPAYINGSRIGPYPVNADGQPLDAVRDKDNHPLPAEHPKMQPARYQLEIPVVRPFR